MCRPVKKQLLIQSTDDLPQIQTLIHYIKCFKTKVLNSHLFMHPIQHQFMKHTWYAKSCYM